MCGAIGSPPGLARRQFLELLHRRQDGLARRPGEQLAQVADAFGLLGVAEATGTEGLGDLIVEVSPVGHDHQRGVVLPGIVAQLERQPQDGQALARALGVPDHAAPIGGFLGGAGTLHGLVHGNVLLIAAQLADDPTAGGIALEHDETPHQVEQRLRREQPGQGHILDCRLSSTHSLKLARRARPGGLPFGEEPMRRGHCAVHGRLAAGRDQHLRRLEQLWRTQIVIAVFQLLVARELVNGLGLPALAQGRALALDDGHRQTVHEDHHVRDDHLLAADHAELPGDDEFVLGRIVEVDEADRLPLLAVAQVLVERDALGDDGVDPLAGLDQAGRLHVGDGPHRLGQVIL